MSFYTFTDHGGEVFKVALEGVLISVPSIFLASLDGLSETTLMATTQSKSPSTSPLPLPMDTVSVLGNTASKIEYPRQLKELCSRKTRSFSDQTGNDSYAQKQEVRFVYNDYGELLNIETMKSPVSSADLTVTETLRLILRAYHNEFRTRMGHIVALRLNGGAQVGDDDPLAYSGQLFLWNFTAKTSEELPPDELEYLCVYRGPPKVLDIGCGDGTWCFKVKEAHPDWIVEGLDEKEYWLKTKPGLIFRDFMDSSDTKGKDNCFAEVHMPQDNVEFTVRNINSLLSHSKAIPRQNYSFIRARDVFSKLESYKGFLEDVRRILQPEGVVEFIEIDPRPRVALARRRRSVNESHISRPQTDWTDNIADRFKDPYDEQLARIVPEWTQRVEERMKAALRPRDGVPAAHLKSWLEGAGFWDVKQLTIRLPVGGDSPTGKVLLDFMKYQTDLENLVPLLATRLPTPNFHEISFGNFYINMHIVSGRKPKDPRPGDMLRDGTRQGMTASSSGIANGIDTHNSSQWTRAFLDTRLATMTKTQVINNLSTPKNNHERRNLSSTREKSERASQ